MTEEKPKTTKTIGTLIVAAAAGAAGAMVLATPVVGAALALAPAVTEKLLDQLIGHRRRQASKRAQTWFAQLTGDDQADVALLEAQLHAEGDDVAVQDVVLEGARAFEDALLDEVVPLLGRLTRSYRMQKRPADMFFRGMRRLLCDLGADELRTFREFVRRAQGAEFDDDETEISFIYRSMAQGEPMQLGYLRRNTPEQRKATNSIFRTVPLGDLLSVVPIFELMKRNGLARDGTGGTYGSQPGPRVAVFDCVVLAEMWSVVQ